MNIGSVEPHGSSAPFAPHADGELFVDRSQGLKKKGDEGGGGTDGSLPGLKKGGSSTVSNFKKLLSEAVAAEKPVISKAKETIPSPSPPIAKAEKKTRRKKKWRKPKDKPNRPLSAYNLFFARERALMLGDDAPTPEQEALKKRVHCKTHGKIGFAVMARTIGAKWKALEPEQKEVFEDMAKKEKDRYQIELAAWKDAQRNKGMESDLDSARGIETVSIPMNASSILSGRMAATNPFQQMQAMRSAGTHPSGSMRFLFEGGMNRRNLSHLQAAPQAEYFRNMQDLPVEQAALLGMPQRQMMMDASSQGQPFRYQQQQFQQQQGQNQDQQYPNAAEASANTLLNHFQQGVSGSNAQNQVNPQSQQQQNLMDQQLFQEFAAMRRIQQRFMAGGYGMNGMGGMNAMNAMNGMNVSMTSAVMNPFGINNSMNMSGSGGMNNNMSMRGGGMNMNHFGHGM